MQPPAFPGRHTVLSRFDQLAAAGQLGHAYLFEGPEGSGKEATALWIKYGLEVLHLKKICLHTLNTNIRNIKLNEELGFAVEGILHNEVFIDGRYHDVLRMGMWRE